MIRRLVIILALCASDALAIDVDDRPPPDWEQLQLRPSEAEKPKLDPKRIINESNSFLKEREPEMTAEEYALYEKVVTTLSNNPEFALRLLEGMMNEKEPPSPAFRFILGNVYASAGQHDKAEASYLKAVEKYPTFLRAWNNLGILYHTLQRYDKSAECFSKCVTLGDRDATTFGLLGYALEKQKNLVSAEMAYLQALSGAPNNSDWKEGLLRIYIQGRQFGRAEFVVKNLIREQSKEPRLWLTYANILVAENRKLEATAILEAAVSVGVEDADELGLLGDLYAEQKLSAETVRIYQKLLVLSPDLGERKLLKYAQAMLAAGKLVETQHLLDGLKGDSLSPEGRVAAQQLKVDLLEARREWKLARSEIQALLLIAPMNGKALLSLGRTYTAEDDWARASLAFEQAYRLPPTTYPASLELAKIELRNRHYAKAVEYLEKALSIEKKPEVEDYLARIKALSASSGPS